MQNENRVRGRAEVARRAHNPEVVGSSPAPATKGTRNRNAVSRFSFFLLPFTILKFDVTKRCFVFLFLDFGETNLDLNILKSRLILNIPFQKEIKLISSFVEQTLSVGN